MKLLLDTHAFYWWLTRRPELSAVAHDAISDPDNDVQVSVASLWEMAIRAGVGKWPEALPLVSNFETELATEGFALLAISVSHARMAGLMTGRHRDPFDRLLVAQSRLEAATLVSGDPKLTELGAAALW